MHIAFAASECVPFSKTGGLADVIGALPPALVSLGHKATVFLPRYRQTKLDNPATVISSITVPFDDHYRFCSVLDGGVRSGVQFYFIDYPPFFDRDGLYGTALGDYHDNAERFALFSRAVLEATKILGAPDVLHCHDWQTALGSHTAEDTLRRRSRVRDDALHIHHSQPRIPGTLSAGDPAAAHVALGPVHHVEVGILRQGQLPEGRHLHGRLHYHGQPQVRPGDPDGRIRLRSGGRAAGARQHDRRHPQRRRLRLLESRDRSLPSPRATPQRTSAARRNARPIC